MCAIEAAKRGRRVLVLDKANKPGKKILMSGGGRCNFTNLNISSQSYLSHNPHFCKSALSRYTQWDFISMVEKHGIAYYEKTLGQLFCVNKSSDIVGMLLSECQELGVEIKLKQTIHSIRRVRESFLISVESQQIQCQSLVIASGGLSIPTMGASPFGYQVAEQFGHRVYPTRAGLVPFTLHQHDKQRFELLSGCSVACEVSCNGRSFSENLLFTHRGLSGPAMLQISSYWNPGDNLTINLLPEIDLDAVIQESAIQSPELQLQTLLKKYLPKSVISVFLPVYFRQAKLKTLLHKQLESIVNDLQHWKIKPNGTEGYRTAEVTLGGVDCDEVSSKTFESNKQQGLYFIGEVLDVTGWLGGYNFQWAWSSGWAAGQVV